MTSWSVLNCPNCGARPYVALLSEEKIRQADDGIVVLDEDGSVPLASDDRYGAAVRCGECGTQCDSGLRNRGSFKTDIGSAVRKWNQFARNPDESRAKAIRRCGKIIARIKEKQRDERLAATI